MSPNDMGNCIIATTPLSPEPAAQPADLGSSRTAGSMLCGQHALNNLLQDNLFTAPDLAEIARSLDALEASQLGAGNHLAGDSPWETSQNYDDSGFFSVQGALFRTAKRFGFDLPNNLTCSVAVAVMEQALKLWNLRLIRWGSQEMQHVHDNPESVFLSQDCAATSLRFAGSKSRR